MKHAVIQTGGKQYVVVEGQELDIELVGEDTKLTFEPLLIFDEENTQVGTPTVSGAKVTAEVLEEFKDKKVIAIRYKAKKRVRKTKGHRQRYSRIKIGTIA